MDILRIYLHFSWELNLPIEQPGCYWIIVDNPEDPVSSRLSTD